MNRRNFFAGILGIVAAKNMKPSNKGNYAVIPFYELKDHLQLSEDDLAFIKRAELSGDCFISDKRGKIIYGSLFHA
jgi:hypothetical protein